MTSLPFHCLGCHQGWLGAPWYFWYLPNMYDLFFLTYCCSVTVVPPFFPLLTPMLPPHSHSQSPHCPCPWVFYTCSFACPFLIFTPLSPSPVPSGYCQFVLYFHVSGSMLLAYKIPLTGEIIWYLCFYFLIFIRAAIWHKSSPKIQPSAGGSWRNSESVDE